MVPQFPGPPQPLAKHFSNYILDQPAPSAKFYLLTTTNPSYSPPKNIVWISKPRI